MCMPSSSLYQLIVALVIIAVAAFLLYTGKVTSDVFTGIVGVILGYYFGSSIMFMRMRAEAK